MSKYTVESGTATAFLYSPDGFLVAECFSLDGEGKETPQGIADKLNRLEALERSHADLVEALKLHDNTRSAHEEITGHFYDGSNLSILTARALSRARPLKTPTAAPQGQQ